MEANFFAKPFFHHVLKIVLFIFLTISITSSACDDNSSTIPTNSTKTIDSNNTSNFAYTNPTQTYITYIKNSCNLTTYPSICYQSLYPYALKVEADPLKLSNISLSIALDSARSASSTISKLLNSNEINLTSIAEQVVQDCFGNVKDSIEQLQDSLDVLSHLDDEVDRDFQISNIKTWVSSAITNDQTCYDELDEMNVDPIVRDKIRKNILNVARKTSNALYFINNELLSEGGYN